MDALTEAGRTAAGDWLTPTAALARFNASTRSEASAAAVTLRHGVRVGELGFLVPQRAKAEVVAMDRLARIPKSTLPLLGILNLRGNLVPVFDANGLIGTRRGTALGARVDKRMVLVLDKGERAAGLAIDDYPRVVDGLRPVDAAAAIPSGLSPHVRGTLLAAEDLWLELDYETLLAALSAAAH